LKKIAAPQVKKTLLTPEEKPQEQAAAAPAEKPVLGTPAWKAYCARKYVSFNPDKGTYQSKTGVERPCLVTSDFK